ncbi:hypothetical protein CEP52_007398 [Fusarium oligoseptatum]|uniref:Uncharacterized protein n=1 Tax=Fusarium oligoseptatum TaxID=2604345 RepID=A0A428TMZ3_9HYPO|nr:hypothetical protein CEP52_007398 [Fusarium oligoseptatum]
MEESNPRHVDSGSAPTQLRPSIMIRFRIDGTTIRIDRQPSRSSHVDGTAQVTTNSLQDSTRERSATVEALEISEMREKLRNAEVQDLERQAQIKALRQEVERLNAQREATRSIAEEISTLKQERDSVKKQMEEDKKELEKLGNAVGSSLEARFYKCQFELANNHMQNQEGMAMDLRAAHQDIDGLNAHIARLNEEDDACGFEPAEPSHTTLKRKAVECLYRHGTPDVKKMRLAEETYLNLEGFRPAEACELVGNINNEVLRVAAKAGLLNFRHFSTGPSGTLGLTEFGLKKAAISDGFRSYLEEVENGEKETAELTAKARNILSKGGFWVQGHPSLLPLKDLLNGQELLNAAKMLHDSFMAEMTEEMMEAFRKPMRALYSKYETRKLSFSTNFMLANDLPGRPRLEMARELFKVAFNYFDLFDFSKEIVEKAKLPPQFASPSAAEEELARSLAAHKKVSSDIDNFLAVIDEEY